MCLTGASYMRSIYTILILALLTEAGCKRPVKTSVNHFKSTDGNAVSGACLDQWKARAAIFPDSIDSTLSVPANLKSELEFFRKSIAGAKASNSKFLKRSNSGLITALSVETVGNSGANMIYQVNQIRFEKGNASYRQQDKFTETQEISVYSQKFYLGKVEISASINPTNCTRTVTDIDLLRFDIGSATSTMKHSVYNMVTKTPEVTSDAIATNLLAGARQITDAFSDMEKITHNLSVHAFADTLATDLLFTFRDIGNATGLDALVGSQVPLRHFEIDLVQDGKLFAKIDLLFSSKSHYFKKTILGDTTESINKQSFLNLPLSTDAESIDKAKFSGFKKEDFQRQTLSFSVTANAELSFENYLAYFDFARNSGANNVFSYLVKTHPPVPLSELSITYPGEIGPQYAAYLKGSYYITIDDPGVQNLANTIRQKLGSSPKYEDFLKAILAGVSSSLTYDHEALANNAVSLMRASDALKRGKGVCQHYAAVFVAASRALGIPARVISGFYLDQDEEETTPSAGPHAWVEVLVGGRLWMPLEPQIPDLQTLSSMPVSYFPMEVMNSYEKQQSSGNDFADIIAMYNREKGITFTVVDEKKTR